MHKPAPLFLLLLVSFSFSTGALAQETSPGAPPVPQPPAASETHFLAGAHVFGGYYFGNGPTLKCDCVFDNNKGDGFSGGIDFEYKISKTFSFVASAEYTIIHAIYQTSRVASEQTVDGTIDVTFKRAATVDLTYGGLSILAKWKPGLNETFILAGAAYGLFLDGKITDEERVATSGYVYPDHTNQKIFLDGKLKDFFTMNARLAAIGGIGYDFSFGNTQISPALVFSFPFSSVASQFSLWKLSAFGAGVSIRTGI
jgi:hypothetical protein